MSKQWPQGAETGEILRDDDEIGLYKPSDTPAVSDGSLNKKKRIDVFRQELNLDGLYLNEDRIAMQELTSSELVSTGWWTIAESDVLNNDRIVSDFSLTWLGGGKAGTFSFHVNCNGSGNAKTFENTTLEIKGKSSFGATGDGGIDGVRLAKSDSVVNSGFKIQININTNITPEIQLSNNLGFTSSGFKLIAPTQTDIGLLPDGVTAATFLEAGEEKEYRSSFYPENIFAQKGSDDVVRITAPWGQFPKQGTVVTITFPSTNLKLIDGAGTTVTLTSTTESSPQFIGEEVSFQISNVAAFSTLNNGPLVVQANGTGLKITIT